MSSFEANLKCAIHLDFYKVPKRMPHCPHIFCKTCIDKLRRERPNVVKCPTCREEQRLPIEGATGLITDLTVQSMVENATCVCGKISGTTKDCTRCNIKFCIECSLEHCDPLRCKISTNTRKLEQIMNTERFKNNIEDEIRSHQEEIEKIMSMRTEIDTAFKYIMDKLTAMKAEFTKRLPNPQLIAKRQQELKQIQSYSGVIEKSKQLMNDRSSPQQMLNSHNAAVEKVLGTVTSPNSSLNVSDAMGAAYAQLTEFLALCGWLRGFQDNTVSTLVTIPSSEDEAQDVAWDPIDNSVCVSGYDKVHYFRPFSKKQMVTETTVYCRKVTCLHVNSRGERMFSDGKVVGYFPSGTLIAPMPNHRSEICIAISSFEDESTDVVYALAQTMLYRAKSAASGRFRAHFEPMKAMIRCGTDITTDRQGRILVVDNCDRAVLVLAPDGMLLHKIQKMDEGHLNSPVAICIDPFDNVHVTEIGGLRIIVFDSNHQYLTKIEDINSEMTTPRRIAVDRLKRVFVVEQENPEITILHDKLG